MYARVVRFTDVTAEQIGTVTARVEESDGPPPGVPAMAFQLLLDEEQGTAVVVQFFDSAEDMAAAEEALSGMDASETPGTRVSVDRCEVKADMRVGA